MALFDPKDLLKPFGALAAMAASAAVGFVAGYALGRDPAAARRLLKSVARGVDRAQAVVAETREELGDLWADARASARAEWEEARFAEPAAEQVAPEEIVSEAPPAAQAARRPTARRPRRTRTTPVH
jgi:hypothetical protein